MNVYEYRKLYFMAPDDGGGAGGTQDPPDPNNPPAPELKYSDEDLKKHLEVSMKKWRKGLQREVKEKEDAIAGLNTKLQEAEQKVKDYEEKISNIPAPGEGASKAELELRGQMEMMQKKHENVIKGIQKQMEEAKAKQEAAELKAKETRRDTLLNQALSKAGCVDLTGGYRYFRPIVVWDPDEDDWMIQTGDGNLLSLEEGCRDMLPDYLKPASAQEGGSGSRTGSPTKKKKFAELDQARKDLEAIKEAVRKRPQDTTLFDQYQQKRDLVRRLTDEYQNVT